ncbi:MAG: DUF1624 domain-containing protein [Lachnospiraceae bacterium]|nr:DUF1624 domain-containing protein [Lachnospiraceae bacterium]
MKRYEILDTIRGVTVVSMVLYHTMWDLVYLYGMKLRWYESSAAYICQQSICWTFILLSGFCFPMGRRKLKRSLTVFAAGLIVTLVTAAFVPDSRVIFGVLTLLGSSMLIMTALDRAAVRVRPCAGLMISLLLFFLLRDVNEGYLGFEILHLCVLPKSWYQNPATTYLGFPYRTFFSTDYFSLLPWFFLFTAGYYLYHLMRERNWLIMLEKAKSVRPLSFIGRHSLEIYLIHQPVITVILNVLSHLA